MFTNVILAIIENDEGNVSTKLLQSSQMVFTIDNRDIVTHVTKEPSSQEHNMQEPADINAVVVATGTDKTWREDRIVIWWLNTNIWTIGIAWLASVEDGYVRRRVIRHVYDKIWT